MSSVEGSSVGEEKKKRAEESTSEEAALVKVPTFMRQENIRSRCALAYVDKLFVSTAIHRHKSVQYIFQRVATLCARQPDLSERTARILLGSLTLINTLDSSNQFIDLTTATAFFKRVLNYALGQFDPTDLVVVGSTRILEYFFLILTRSVGTLGSEESRNLFARLEKLPQVLLLTSFETTSIFTRLTHTFPIQCSKQFQHFFKSFPHEPFKYNFLALLEVITKDLRFNTDQFDLDCADHTNVVSRIHAFRIVQDYEGTPFLLAVTICYLARKAKCPVRLTVDCMAAQANKMIENQMLESEPVKKAVTNSAVEEIVKVLRKHGSKCTETPEALFEAVDKNTGFTIRAHFAYAVTEGIMYMVANPDGHSIHERRSADFQGSSSTMNEFGALTNTWNGKNFVLGIHLLAGLQWKMLIGEFDSDSFHVDRPGLRVFKDIMDEAFPGNTFPVQYIYAPHKYTENHFELLKTIVENSDIMCLADYPHTPVVQSHHNLKTMPDETDRAIANWQCSELTSTFLLLAVQDQALQEPIKQLFTNAMLFCADVIALALIQAPLPSTKLRIELLEAVLPKIILQSVNAVSILNFAWNRVDPPFAEHIKKSILAALASLYVIDDQTKLAKILDIAHELKPSGLSDLLTMADNNLNFVVDLACLASKRSYLNIEKWLEDKHKTYGDSLISTVLSHIQRRYKRPALVTAVESQTTTALADPIGILLTYVNQKANQAHRIQYQSIFQVMKESGRSSSVSSTGGRNPVQMQSPVVFPQGPLRQDSRGMNQMGNFVPPPMNFQGLVQQPHMMGQQQQQQPLAPGMMGNMSNFGAGSRDLLKTYQPAPSMPPSTSPSNQMMRSQMSMTQRQNSSSGGWHSGAATPSSRPSGPSTPSGQQHMDYRPLSQPPVLDFNPRLNMNQQAQEEYNKPFPEEVQSDANTFFEKLYNTSYPMQTSELIIMMKQLKSSQKERDQQILDCIIDNLFEEYRFFHDYPERELRVTAEIYGGIIREGIIEKIKFVTGMRKVVDALNSDPSSKLFQFVTIVLQNCKTALNQYPKMCAVLSKMTNFKHLPQSVRDYVVAGETGGSPAEATRASTPVWQMRTNDSKSASQPNRSILSYTNIDTLVQITEKDGENVEQPAEAIVDKVAFLFNNLSNTNLNTKKDELLSLIKENGDAFLKWLAQYIVMRRVSLENNFHQMYNMFLICVNSPSLDDLVKKETFRNIKILLHTDKRDPSLNYSDRTLLKNLGTWLGYITIARNRPILLKEIDLRSLLLEAYYKGQSELLFAVPFISKILHSCSKSKLFPPSCAWIRSIMKVLAELHTEPDLKINLKFEIEVLCKELQVDLTSLPYDGVLKDTEKLVRVPQQLNPLRQLARPEVPSPVPQQMRLEASSQSPVSDTKPSTPQPDMAEGGSSNAGAAHSHSVEGVVPPNVTLFSYHDINVHTYEGFYPHVTISATLPIFQLHPYTKQLVRPAMSQAIKELIGPVAERALRIAMTVTENMVKKDFALDPDEQNMKTSAFHMMRAMTAAMAMITCREPLASNIQGYLIQAFQGTLRNSAMSPELQKMIEQAASIVAQDNVELATNFIVKTACEKAAPELEKRLDSEYQRRIAARRDGEIFRDEAVLAIQQRLPAQIAILPGPTDKAVMNVYEQFSSRICGFKPLEETVLEVSRAFEQSQPSKEVTMEALVLQIQGYIQEVDRKTQAQPHTTSKTFQAVRFIRDLLANVVATPRDATVLSNLINQSVEQLLHAYVHEQTPHNPLNAEWNRRLLDLFIGVMKLLRTQFTNPDLARRVTTALIGIRSDYKWNIDGIEMLLKQNLIQKTLWDDHLAASMEGGTNIEASIFAQKYLRALTGGDATKTSTFRELFPRTYEQLAKIQQLHSNRSHETGETPTTAPSEAASTLSEMSAQQRPEDADMTSKVEMILREWIGICYTPLTTKNPQEALGQMIQLMHEHGVLATDDKITQFFRMCVEMCVDVSVRMLKSEAANPQPAHQQTVIRQRCFYTLDAFVKLMALMIRHSDGTQAQNKINLLKKLLKILVGVLHIDHEIRKGEFNAMPYHRIIISLFNEITSPDPQNLLEPIAWSILEAFGQTLFALQPRRLPGFAFAWLDIVGHRHVIGRLLANTGIAETVEPVKTAAMFTQLIISHLKFLAPFLRNIQLPKAIAILYKGTLRVLLVILHDFPELLCEYHYAICDTIPPNCVQLRNLVLSAYPRNMRLPDPFALNFKQVDNITEMSIEPKSNLSMTAIIPEATRTQLDEYLSTRTPVTFLTNLPSLLHLSAVPGQKYNTTVMNAIVLYVGMRAIEKLRENRQRISIHTIAHTSYMDIFQNLAVQLCTEGRYLLFNGIANQLRYPNAHTHYFSCVFLFLFLNSDCDAIQEQITRILFERLVALRPHPWGLLITFIELIKNPQYNFWKYEFTRCAPEIERLFQNVANTCAPPSQAMNTGLVHPATMPTPATTTGPTVALVTSSSTSAATVGDLQGIATSTGATAPATPQH